MTRDLPDSGKMFVYGTLTNPTTTEDQFPAEHISSATAIGLRKVGNDVEPGDGLVDGQVFEVSDFEELDNFEMQYRYFRYEAETTDGEPICFYSRLPPTGFEWDVEVQIDD